MLKLHLLSLQCLCTITLAASSFAFSADESFNWLKSTSGENSALSGSCDYIGNSKKMTCNIRQISVKKETSKEKANEMIAAYTEELEIKLNEQGLTKYASENFGDYCEQMASITTSQREGNKETFEKIEAICKSPSKENIMGFFLYSINKEKNTCKVFDYDTGDYSFTSVSDNKWVSNNGPKGTCGAIVVMTLERHPEHSTLWTYSQNKQYTNLKSDLCKSLAEAYTPVSYSWNGNSPIKMDCTYIDFGF